MNRCMIVIAAVLALATGVFSSGCMLTRPVADPTRFYVLAALDPEDVAENHNEQPPANGLSVGLRRIQMADYLNTPAITVRTGENSLRYSEFNRWAEGLDRGASRIVREHLRRDPHVGSVLLFPEASREAIRYEIDIQLLACEAVEHPDGSGGYSFRAFWKVFDAEERSVVAGGDFTRAGSWSPRDYAAFAHSISIACGELGQEIALRLRELEGGA